ncbi:MAG TPA: endonuclease/exonuclease/phosphatase family protein [Jatrophihabitans sp.]|nr:endonuclease/exonuclease/phosphatase family protein [Jatrophihabitans sp.]
MATWCCLVSSVVWLTGSATARQEAGFDEGVIHWTISGRVSGPALRELQLNLCDSGLADCFTGRAVDAAAGLIRDQRPDIVTLNEICRGDVSVLARAMSSTYRGAVIASAFKAAADRRTNGPYRCQDGERYGIGVLARMPSSASAYRSYSGGYPMQDPGDPEERVWLCIDVATEFIACTTHAASTSTTLAFAQCRYLLTSAVPMVRSQNGDDPVVLGADLNLPVGDAPEPQSCVPDGYQRTDDGARQDIVTSPGFALRSRAVIDMHGTTDHPGLLVELARPQRAAR